MNSICILSSNLISWWIQVTVIAALGTALPILFRIRHARTQVSFYHFILAICVVLPLIEPWHHPLLITASGLQSAESLVPAISWLTYLAWIFVAGRGAVKHMIVGGERVVTDGRHRAREAIVARYTATMARIMTV